jgi:hypothetical protein
MCCFCISNYLIYINKMDLIVDTILKLYELGDIFKYKF